MFFSSAHHYINGLEELATAPEVMRNSRKQLHSAALAIPFEEPMRPQETSLLRIRSDKESSSPTPMTDVRGTLNSVLWGIPTIANQMSFKAHEDPNATDELLQAFKAHKTQSEPLLLFELTEFWGSDFDFITSSSSSRTPFVESSPAKQVPESTHVSERLANLDSEAEEKQCRDCDGEGASLISTQLKETHRGKHLRLMKRQMKIESEAWQQAIQEYKATLEEMCKNQLAPNLPFMKSMFLSWFEPLVNAITAEQEAYQRGDYRLNRSSYGPYLALLPADKLAVITMHKTVAKLLTEDANVGLRVIVPVLSIGEAVEQEVRI